MAAQVVAAGSLHHTFLPAFGPRVLNRHYPAHRSEKGLKKAAQGTSLIFTFYLTVLEIEAASRGVQTCLAEPQNQQ